MESFVRYEEKYPVQWDIMYLYLALECDLPILKAYSKAVYSRKQQQCSAELDSLNIENTGLGTACIHLKNNQIHRTEGPAVVFEDGSYIWYFWGKVSRLNGPALSFKNYMRWEVNGLLHRLDGPATLTKTLQTWAINGITHRQDGPALEHGHTLEQLRKNKHFRSANYPHHIWHIAFYINGLLHREYPHAAKIECFPGEPVLVEFWNNGKLIQRLRILEYSELEPYL
jgi:hypothetical protein